MTPPSIKDVARLAEVSIGTDSNVLRPTAMFCSNDLLALGALQEAIANDLKVLATWLSSVTTTSTSRRAPRCR